MVMFRIPKVNSPFLYTKKIKTKNEETLPQKLSSAKLGPRINNNRSRKSSIIKTQPSPGHH